MMKIQANMTRLKCSNSDSEKKTMKTAIPQLADQTVRMSISQEGYANYRKMIESQSFDDIIKQRELLTKQKISTDLDYNFRLSAEVNSLNEADKAVNENSMLSNEDKMDNLAEAYTSLYDEIIKGYETGTREINVLDSNSEKGYRTLTMQEELENLESAYEKAVQNMTIQIEQESKIQAAFEKYMHKLQKIGADRAELANAYANRRFN